MKDSDSESVQGIAGAADAQRGNVVELQTNLRAWWRFLTRNHRTPGTWGDPVFEDEVARVMCALVPDNVELDPASWVFDRLQDAAEAHVRATVRGAIANDDAEDVPSVNWVVEAIMAGQLEAMAAEDGVVLLRHPPLHVIAAAGPSPSVNAALESFPTGWTEAAP